MVSIIYSDDKTKVNSDITIVVCNGDDDDLVEEQLLTDNDNDESVTTSSDTGAEDYQENDNSDDYDYHYDYDYNYNYNYDYDYDYDYDYNYNYNYDYDYDYDYDYNYNYNYDDIENDDNDDNNGYRNSKINSFDDYENLLRFIEEETLDCWSKNVQVDPNDSSLTKEQKLILFLMTKCLGLINMIRKSSILTLYFNHQRKILKMKHNILRDVCTRWNSTYFMIHSLLVVRPIIERLYNDKYNLNITNEQIEKLNELEITTTEWNFLIELRRVLKVFQHATKNNFWSTLSYNEFSFFYFKFFEKNIYQRIDMRTPL